MKILFTVITFICCLSCTHQVDETDHSAANTVHSKIDAQGILDKSIAFHDPANQWNSLKKRIKLKSTFVYPDSSNFDLEIGLDNASSRVIYSNLTLEEKVDFKEGSCQIIKGNKTCDQVQWTQGFYHFIPGLPMTLKGDEAVVEDLFLETYFYGTSCYKIQVDFKKERWHFYISKENYQLLGYAFRKNFVEKAEEIRTEGLYEIDQMKLTKSRSWWITTDSLAPIYSGKDEIVGHGEWR